VDGTFDGQRGSSRGRLLPCQKASSASGSGEITKPSTTPRRWEEKQRHVGSPFGSYQSCKRLGRDRRGHNRKKGGRRDHSRCAFVNETRRHAYKTRVGGQDGENHARAPSNKIIRKTKKNQRDSRRRPGGGFKEERTAVKVPQPNRKILNHTIPAAKLHDSPQRGRRIPRRKGGRFERLVAARRRVKNLKALKLKGENAAKGRAAAVPAHFRKKPTDITRRKLKHKERCDENRAHWRGARSMPF